MDNQIFNTFEIAARPVHIAIYRILLQLSACAVIPLLNLWVIILRLV